MTNLPALSDESILALMSTAPDKRERAGHVAFGMELVSDDRFPRPVPRFLVDLPFVGDDDDTQLRIAAQLFLADDPDASSLETKTVAARDFVAKTIVVNDIRTNGSTEKGKWGAYLLIDATVADTGERQMFNTGAPQAIVRLAIAYARGELPLQGAFAEIGGTGRNGNPVITFIAEQDL